MLGCQWLRPAQKRHLAQVARCCSVGLLTGRWSTEQAAKRQRRTRLCAFTTISHGALPSGITRAACPTKTLHLRKLWSCCVPRLSCAQADAARAERYPNLVSPTRLKVLAVRRTVGRTVTQRTETRTCVDAFRPIRSRYRGSLLLQAATCASTASLPPTSLCRT